MQQGLEPGPTGLLEAKQENTPPHFPNRGWGTLSTCTGQGFRCCSGLGVSACVCSSPPSRLPRSSWLRAVAKGLSWGSEQVSSHAVGWMVGSRFGRAGLTHSGGEGDPAGKTSLGACSHRARAVAVPAAPPPVQHELLLLPAPRLVPAITRFSILRG